MAGRRLPLIVLACAALAGAAQAAPYRPPRTAFGAPDLEGVWSNGSFTRLERPKELHSLVVPQAEAAAFDRGYAQAWSGDNSDGVGGRTSEGWELGSGLARIAGQARSSWIVDPPDGLVPYSAEGRRLREAAQARIDSFDGPESRSPADRCLLGARSTSGPPMLNANYNNHYSIVQTRDQVVILVEMIHDARVISLSRKAHLPAQINPWMGDSIGRWDKDTLVVETTNFNPGEAMTGQLGLYKSPAARVTERFTRISAGELLYEFTVEDPSVYSRPWRGEVLLRASNDPVYEYACHEGNYSLEGMLAGARQKERDAQAAGGAKSP
jgi:hypothetical protein